MRGRFITFEGGEGAGKSTQVARLAERLADRVGAPLLTREPGGSEGAESIRDLLVTGSTDRWSSLSETLLIFAARDDHLRRAIRPALDKGRWVICDRFSDSTRAYQGAAGGVARAFISSLEAEVIGEDRPDLTLILDVQVETGLERALARGGAEGRFEAKGLAFHQRLRAEFATIARAEPERCELISADGSPDHVADRIWHAVVCSQQHVK
jgi:dTMP kinase